MDIQIKFCQNCGDEYCWYVSGFTDKRRNESHQYCNECGTAVKNALASIPKKSEEVWKRTTEVTLDELLKEEEKIRIAHETQGRLQMHRVWCGTYCEKLGGWEKIEEVLYKFQTYRYRYHPWAKDDPTIEKKVRVKFGTDEEFEKFEKRV